MVNIKHKNKIIFFSNITQNVNLFLTKIVDTYFFNFLKMIKFCCRYGGIHLGPDRFRHINNAARQVLLQAGFIKSEK